MTATACGTPAGYYRHRRAGTPPCDPCRTAASADTTRRRRQAAAAGRPYARRTQRTGRIKELGSPVLTGITPTEIDRFNRREWTAQDECRIWLGPTNSRGYGRFTIHRDGREFRILSHRLAFFLSTGIDPGRQVVRHSCDTPACYNPAHLSTGTQVDNWQDSHIRGRAAVPPRVYGERHHNAKLTCAAATSIRARHAAGMASQTQLAREFGVSRATVQRVIQGKAWAGVWRRYRGSTYEATPVTPGGVLEAS